MKVVLGYVPVPSQEVGKALARALVKQDLAACCNILGPMCSLYKWGGELCEDSEFLLLAKVSDRKRAEAQALLEREHPYDLPCIVWYAADSAFPAFAAWVEG